MAKWIEVPVTIVNGRSGSPRNSMQTKALLLARKLLGSMNFSYRQGASPIPHHGLPTAQLKRVKDYIQGHLDIRITVTELAKLIHMNEFYFARLFKKSTNVTPCRYIRHQRMLLAQDLLSDPELKVIDVSLRVGFEYPGNFARIFRREVGLSPWEFRHIHLGEKKYGIDSKSQE